MYAKKKKFPEFSSNINAKRILNSPRIKYLRTELACIFIGNTVMQIKRLLYYI